MDPVNDTPAPSQDALRPIGQMFIGNHWIRLTSRTRMTLRRAGFYGEKGARIPDAERGFGPFEQVNDLERALGGLQTHLDSAPAESEGSNLVDACYQILYVPEWRDPEFLRLALSALAAHLQARAVAAVDPAPRKRAPLAIAAWTGGALVLLAAPFMAAWALVAAHEGLLAESALGMYVVAAAIAIVLQARRSSRRKARVTKEERDLSAWQRHSLAEPPVIGAGHRFRLEQLVRGGVTVPTIAFDLVAALEVETARQLESGA